MKKDKKIIDIFFISIILIIFIIIGILITKYTYNRLDSDHSTELILSNLLSKENKLITSNWYYTTELRVLNTQLIMMPLFKMFSSYKIVRILSVILCNFLMIVVYFYFMKKLEIKENWIKYFTCLLLLCPISEVYLDIITIGMYYIPHIIIAYIYIGIYFDIIKKDKNIFKIIVFILLSFICGISGIRYLLIFQIPLFMTIFFIFLKENKYIFCLDKRNFWNNIKLYNFELKVPMILVFAGIIFSGIGYIINIFILSRIYSNSVFGYTKFIFGTDDYLKHIGNVFSGLFSIYGYRAGTNLFSVSGIINLLILVMVLILVYTIYYLIKYYFKNIELNKENILLIMFIISFTMNFLIFCILDMYTSRYYITILFWLIPCIALYLNKEKRYILKVCITSFIFITYMLSTILNFYTWSKEDINKNKYDVVEYLEQNNLNFGYATFWNANIITELSNGKIEVANITDPETMQPYLWGTPKYYYNNYKESEKRFILLSQDEYKIYKECSLLKNRDLVFNNGNYIIFQYKNIFEINSLLN